MRVHSITFRNVDFCSWKDNEAQNETLQASVKGKEELTKGKEEQEKAPMDFCEDAEGSQNWAPLPILRQLFSSGLLPRWCPY
jgi:hypothetical protein